MSVPMIRFTTPEGEYPAPNIFRIGDISTWARNNSLSRDSLNNEDGPFQNIHYGDIHTKYPTLFFQRDHSVPYVTLGALRPPAESDYCRAGDLVIADASEDLTDVGKTIEIVGAEPSSLVAGLHTHLLRPTPDIFAPGYAGYMMRSPSVRTQIERAAQGTKVYGLSKKNVADITVVLPSLPEQRRIADALTAVDAKIDLLGRKRDALARFKAGLMQKLFSQEVRFTHEDGSAYPDWEEKEIRDLLTICYGKDHKHLGTGDIPVYGTGGLMRYADTAIHTGPSILIGRKGTIDKPRYVEGPFWTVDTVFYTKVKEGADPFLLFSILQTVEWLSLNEASGVPSLNANTVGSVLITIPTDLYEQRQISAALRSLDAKIEAVSRQITTMQAFKKGLLQQMFV